MSNIEDRRKAANKLESEHDKRRKIIQIKFDKARNIEYKRRVAEQKWYDREVNKIYKRFGRR